MAIQSYTGGSLDQEHLKRVEALFENGNLLEIILRAHLLIERAMTVAITRTFPHPDFFNRSNFTFYQKSLLYMALSKGKTDLYEGPLLSLNKLRNRIAHEFCDIEQAVFVFFPLAYRGQPRPTEHLKREIAELLFYTGALLRDYGEASGEGIE